MYEVKDGSRTLTFNGKLLGASSSYRRGSTRWIEFELYQTESGSYVLSRVGVSVVFHSAACELVSKYGLHDTVVDELSDTATPCESCQPTFEAQIVFPEKYRYWAQVSDDPQAVLDALYKRDDNGAKYLTRVAQRVLDEASEVDSAIDEVYHFEFID
jgi:hypothetical protein